MLKSIQKITNFFEQYFSKLKTVLEPRQFLYISSVLVGLSAALAVIVLKTFAHNVFLFSQYLNKEFHFDKKSKKDGFKGIIESLVQNIEALGVNFSKTNYEEEKNKSNTMKYYDFNFKKIETLLSEKSKLKYKIIRSKEISRLPELNEKMVTSSYLRWGLNIRI